MHAPEFLLPLATGLAGAAMLGVVTVKPATAQQTPSPPQQNSGAGAGGENNGEDFTRPLISFRYAANIDPQLETAAIPARSVR